jgi:flagellar protein FlaJ
LLTPALNIGFIVFVAIIKRDEPGDGRLPHPREDTGAGSDSDTDSTASDVLTTDVVESYTGTHDVFDRIKEKQKLHQVKQVLAAPQKLWAETPVYTLPVTIPVVIAGVAIATMTGIAPSPILPASWVSDTTATTVIWFYFPVLTVITPIAVFHEIGKRSTVNITSELSDGLRKVASANDTGQTLQKAIRTVGENGRGQLAKEFEAIHEKSVYGVGLQQAFIEFNNKYETPRLARITKLVTESREATNNVSDVLLTAARVNETNERMAKDQRDRTRMQTVIIMMSFLILLAVTLLLNENLISLLSGVSQSASAGVSGINGELVSMFFFHTVTIQGAFAGAVTGYIKSSSVLDGLKFSIGLLLITLTAWVVIV